MRQYLALEKAQKANNLRKAVAIGVDPRAGFHAAPGVDSFDYEAERQAIMRQYDPIRFAMEKAGRAINATPPQILRRDGW